MKKRRGKHTRRNVSQAVAFMAVILCLAVAAGFLGVKYLVSPWMNGEGSRKSEQMAQNEKGEKKTEVSDEKDAQKKPQPSLPQSVVEDKVEKVATKAFAVQLGSFATEEGARQRIQELSVLGIQSSAQLRDGAWKVVSSGYHTKEEAKAAAVKWKDAVGDAFVVEI